jgi:DNA polymerase III subunit delta
MPALYANQLAAALAKALPPVVLLWGDEAGAIRQAAQQIQQAVTKATGTQPDDPFAAESFTLPDLATNPTRLTESAQTVAFGGGHRLITLSGVSGAEADHQLKPLLEALQVTLALPLTGITIILPLPKLLEKTSALVKLVEKHPSALSVRFYQDVERDLGGWLQTEVKSLGKSLAPDAQALLLANLGADREVARRELEKLVLYAGNEVVLTTDHAQASLAGAIVVDGFRLAEAVANRNLALTDRLLSELQQQGEDLNGPFNQTVQHLTKLAEAQRLKAQGATPEALLQAAGKARAPQAAQAAFLQQVKAYPGKRLATLPAYTLDTLVAARSGLLDSQLTLARAILALAA